MLYDSKFKPMKARTLKAGALPMFRKSRDLFTFQPKLDGIRCVIKRGKPRSNSGKLIPNLQLRKEIQRIEKLISLEGLDGELIISKVKGKEIKPKDACRITAGIMNSPYSVYESLYFVVFDRIPVINSHANLAFRNRNYIIDTKCLYRSSVIDRDIKLNVITIEEYPDTVFDFNAKMHDLFNIYETEELEKEVDEFLKSANLEGFIARDVEASYKSGRATYECFKYKLWKEAEAVVIGIVQAESTTVSEKDEQGMLKTSKKKEDRVLLKNMGALRVADIKTGIEFKIGTGFSEKDRKFFWDNREVMKYKAVITYKYAGFGNHEKPRTPVFKTLRPGWDIS